jgi:hypothetical protein
MNHNFTVQRYVSDYGLHTCQVTYMTLYTGGFSRFVTSTAAPIATGWSDLAGRIRTHWETVPSHGAPKIVR